MLFGSLRWRTWIVNLGGAWRRGVCLGYVLYFCLHTACSGCFLVFNCFAVHIRFNTTARLAYHFPTFPLYHLDHRTTLPPTISYQYIHTGIVRPAVLKNGKSRSIPEAWRQTLKSHSNPSAAVLTSLPNREVSHGCDWPTLTRPGAKLAHDVGLELIVGGFSAQWALLHCISALTFLSPRHTRVCS